MIDMKNNNPLDFVHIFFQSCPRGGECVPYYLCDENGTIITDGTGTLDERFGEDAETCENTFEVCCMNEAEEPLPLRFEKKEGCGHRNSNGLGLKVSTLIRESQFGKKLLIGRTINRIACEIYAINYR